MDISKIELKYSNKCSVTLSMMSIDTPVGKCIAAADNEFLYFTIFEDTKNPDKKIEAIHKELDCCFKVNKESSILSKFSKELNSYFNGKLKKFSVPLKTFGSDFQKEVWDKLLELPYGSTQSYGDFAKDIGRPGSARAVGAACGANAHLLVIPCHRLIASGSKGGYSSGVDRKELLLQHEQKYS